jgi:hypothetical protein
MSTTFELSEIKDYWCIVALIDNDYENILILKASKDVYKDSMFNTSAEGVFGVEDNGLDDEWINGRPNGVYYLVLEATYDEDDGEKFIDGAKATEVRLLYQLPDDPSLLPANPTA